MFAYRLFWVILFYFFYCTIDPVSVLEGGVNEILDLFLDGSLFRIRFGKTMTWIAENLLGWVKGEVGIIKKLDFLL